MNTLNALPIKSPNQDELTSVMVAEVSAHKRHFMIVEKSPDLWLKLQPHIVGRGDHITASNTLVGVEDILSCQAVDAVLIRLVVEDNFLAILLSLKQNYPNLPVIHINSDGSELRGSASLVDPSSLNQLNLDFPLAELMAQIDYIVAESKQRSLLLDKQNIWHYCSSSNCLIDAKNMAIQLTANEGRFIAVIMQFSAQQTISRHAFAVGLKKEHAKGLDKLLNVIASRIRTKVRQHSNQAFELTLVRGSGIKFIGEIHHRNCSDN
jgi:DNA-binding response OmpR family regulator